MISLYLYLGVGLVVEMMGKETDMKFSNVDFLEATRYLALNWDQDTCNRSRLRRVLPWRRGKRGTRPGMTGTGQRGRKHDDQKQWYFPMQSLRIGRRW